MDRLFCVGELVDEGVIHIFKNRVCYYNRAAAAALKEAGILRVIESQGCFFNSEMYISKRCLFEWQRSMRSRIAWTHRLSVEAGGQRNVIELRVQCINGVIGKNGEYIIVLQRIEVEDGIRNSRNDLVEEKNLSADKDLLKANGMEDKVNLMEDDLYLVGVNPEGKQRLGKMFNLDRNRYWLLVDFLEYPLFLLNENFDVIFANLAAAKKFEDVLSGDTAKDFRECLRSLSMLDDLDSIFRGGSSQISSRIGVGCDGELFERVCIPIVKGRKVVRLMVVLRVIKNFERELLLLGMSEKLPNVLLDMVQVQVLKLNGNLEVVYANQAFKDIFDCDDSQVLGTHIGHLVSTFNRSYFIEELQGILGRKTALVRNDIELIGANGKYLWVDVCAAMSEDDEKVGCVTLTMNDISKRKEQEFYLQEQLLSLRNVKEKMEKFYSIIGHDVKNSMITSQLIASNLLNSWEQANADTIRKYIGYIVQLSNEGVDLLDNLVAWTKSVITGIEFQPVLVHLKPLMLELKRHFEVAANFKGVRLSVEVDCSCKVLGDKNMLKTIFRNILSNAIKFNKRGGTVEVNVYKQNGKVVVGVVDSGVGFNGSFLPDDSSSMAFPEVTLGTVNEMGSGIGLAICRNFIQKHGGSISVFSKKNQGTKVVVEFEQAE